MGRIAPSCLSYLEVSVNTQTRLSVLREEDTPSYRVTYQTQSCTAVDILAVLIGGKRQMEAAEELLSLYRGSLTEINQATVEELSKVKGIGPQAARRIKAAARLNIVLGPKTAQTVINSPADAAALLIPEMSILEKEHFRVILLANRSQVIAIEEVYIGCVGNISIRPAEILAPAIRRNAPQLIVAHNHPSSDPTPSPEDVNVTRVLVQACKVMDITLLDHLVIANGGQWVSLKERGLGFN
jgi:DNA repair protein RadC